MQRIVIKNFGPIREIEMPIHDLTILIGPNASGKSLVARLVYFFVSLQEEVRKKVLISWSGINGIQELEGEFLDEFQTRIIPLRFQSIFGQSEFLRPSSEIHFYYSEDKSISLSSSANNLIQVNNISDKLSDAVQSFVEWVLIHENKLHSPIGEVMSTFSGTEMIRRLNVAFGKEGSDQQVARFIPDDRANAKLTFHQILWRGLQAGQGELSGNNPLSKLLNEQTDTLLEGYAYDRYSQPSISLFSNVALEILIEEEIRQAKSSEHAEDRIFWENLLTFLKQFEIIIQGKYLADDNYAEWLWVQKQKIPLQKSSSGQQEVVGIVVSLFRWLFEKTNTFTVIEEPEAHLFPKEQEYITQLMALALNALPHNQMIITTHSPYIIAAFDYLVNAHAIASLGEKQKQGVADLIPANQWISFDRVGAFMIEEGNIKDMKDYDRKSLGDNMIDDSSEDMAQIFDLLLDIKYAKAQDSI